MKKTILCLLFFTLFSCSFLTHKEGMIQISFQLEGVAPDLNLVPSRQTAVWLENMDNNELTTLYVSEYLSYGGYNDSTICSLWSKKADWEKTPSELFDLVTAATPAVDSVKTISVNCKERNIPAGRYRYNVQVHIIENYNILAQGEFMVGKDNIANVAEISYLPKLYPGTKDILVDVQMKYFLQTSK